MTTVVYIIAWVFVALSVLDIVFTPFYFGQERKPYSAGTWLMRIIIVQIPMFTLLYWVITTAV